jgi:hypothetical protein
MKIKRKHIIIRRKDGVKKSVIKSISNDQFQILRWIMKLYCPDGFECDPTYSKGNFYKNHYIPEPILKFDIDPKTEDTYKSDCRDLPVANNSLKSIIFDPPFLATKGPSLKDGNRWSNEIAKRFGVYPDMIKLWSFYKESMIEFYRVLGKGGLLIFKIQDSVSSGKQFLSHHFVTQCAIDIGFYPRDLFVLLAKSRLVAPWQLINQQHCRKYHCYFLVFQKIKHSIPYLKLCK